MAGDLLYLDSSALVKLVVEEPESAALSEALRAWPLQVSSVVTLVEVPRAARRGSESPEVAARADLLVRQLGLIHLTAAVARDAATLAPSTLRSLDAIHIASARSLGPALGAFATYDERLAEAADTAGLDILVPR